MLAGRRTMSTQFAGGLYCVEGSNPALHKCILWGGTLGPEPATNQTIAQRAYIKGGFQQARSRAGRPCHTLATSEQDSVWSSEVWRVTLLFFASAGLGQRSMLSEVANWQEKPDFPLTYHSSLHMIGP